MPFIENMPGYWTPGEPPEEGKSIPLGKANIVRSGADITVIIMRRHRGQHLRGRGRQTGGRGHRRRVDRSSYSGPFRCPDYHRLCSQTRRAVIVHEAVKSFGVGAEIAACIDEHLHGQLKHRVVRLGAPACPVPFSKPLETAYMPSAERIEVAIRGCLAG